MREIKLILVAVFLGGLLAFLLDCIKPCNGFAQVDPQFIAAITRGSYVGTASIAGSSVAGTAFISANAKRMDGLLFNNTSTTIWIGTVTATANGTTHNNILAGLPIVSSGTFKLDGIMSDVLYFTCDVGIAACNARVVEGLIR